MLTMDIEQKFEKKLEIWKKYLEERMAERKRTKFGREEQMENCWEFMIKQPSHQQSNPIEFVGCGTFSGSPNPNQQK